MDDELQSVMTRVNALVEEYRIRCLWYLREDYYPGSVPSAIRVLEAIQQHGDVSAFKQAGALRQWLLQNSSEASAG
jgi:hypothetical protein